MSILDAVRRNSKAGMQLPQAKGIQQPKLGPIGTPEAAAPVPARPMGMMKKKPSPGAPTSSFLQRLVGK